MNAVNSGDLLGGRYHVADRVPTDLRDLTVWTARDKILDREVRVHVVSGEHTADALDSARRAALIQDPRLVRILDVGTADDIPYVVTEPVTGQTLSEIVGTGIVDPHQARAIVGEAATALEIARQGGVHHLALRPESIHVDGATLTITGLGIDAGVSGLEPTDPDAASRADAQCLVALLYYMMTARWPGPSLDVEWIDPQAVHPLPAHRDENAVVSLSTIRDDAPDELVRLCDETLTDHDGLETRWESPTPTGPAHTGDLASRLRPWGEFSVVAALPEFARAEPEPSPHGVNRQSVRTAFGSSTVPPGTPPPAPPMRRPSNLNHFGPPPSSSDTVAPPVDAPQRPTTPVPTARVPQGAPPVAPTTPSAVSTTARGPSAPPEYGGTPHGHGLLDGMGGVPPSTPVATPPAAPEDRRRFNPTAIILVLALIGLVGGAVWAIGNAFNGFTPPIENRDQSTEQPTPGASEDASQDPPTTTDPPVIASGAPVNPAGQGEGDHPEDAHLAYDGDPSTSWKTHTYKSAQYGNLKSGVGFAVTLEDSARVGSITLTTGNNGGHVEVRATSPDDPTSGEVLASGSLSATTELTFSEPVEGTTFVLWFSELPTASDGGFRVELAEISLS